MDYLSPLSHHSPWRAWRCLPRLSRLVSRPLLDTLPLPLCGPWDRGPRQQHGHPVAPMGKLCLPLAALPDLRPFLTPQCCEGSR